MLFSRGAIAAALVIGACGATLPDALARTDYRAVKQFSIKSNPNAVWSYRYSGGRLRSSTNTYDGIRNLLSWNDNENTPDFVGITANKTGMTQILNGGTAYFPTNYLELDGESDSLGADVRFTVPVTGLYHIAGNFEGCDTQEKSHPVVIEVNRRVIFSSTIDTFESPSTFRIKATMNAKDKMDFISQGAGDGSNVGTCLSVDIRGP